MKKLLLSLLLAISATSAVAQQYDMSEQVINTAHQRSTYYMKDSTFDFGVKFDEFLASADRNIPVVVHSHGCAGIGEYDHLAKGFYTSLGYYFIMLDFHKRGDATAACTGGAQSGFSYHGDLKTRLPARIKELASHISTLRSNGFKTVYATGHSEGGMIVQFLQGGVDGVVIHSMACVPLPPHIDTKNVRTLHLVSLNDPLLGRSNGREVCTNRPNYTAVTSQAGTHSSLAEPLWREKIKEFIVNN